MIARAPAKAAAAGLAVEFRQADVLSLPFPNGGFDAATIAFGIRNVDDPAGGLAEMARCVRQGGRVVVLEFGQPKGLFGWLYRLYSQVVMPRIGGWLSGDAAAYRYLPRTAAAFPAGDAFVRIAQSTGRFSAIHAHPLWGGLVYVYAAEVR
jgi:demethylmenaquinone methyltransferase/2-methoxy-6-polyprenyl-1,4-benzoquinol methylase